MTEKFAHGVIVGRFLPPHAGHHHLIETAVAQCGRLTVILCGKPVDPIPPKLRAAWLRELHPRAEILLIDDREDEQDLRIWAANTLRWLGRKPDAVFTSERYGESFAKHLGAHHVLVDLERGTVPCSGTMIRENPFAHWQFIRPPVRAWYAKRVIVVGAESTGTTTLARDLATELDTSWVAEYGREYSVAKAARNDGVWHSGEFEEIAEEQNRREDLAAGESNGILIGDTNSFATRLWHRRYMGSDLPSLARIATRAVPDLYLLTGDEIPFEDDGLRDGEHIRHEMHRWFRASLESQPVPWLLVNGSREERLAHALAEIRGRWPFSSHHAKSPPP